jgi:glycosyltransferase involved in cell wall biosynthesis
MNNLPLITIITSTYNAGDALGVTIESIKKQSFKNFEWVIIDGNSKDDTLEIIDKNRDVITFCLSESDTGIYDAWNKALNYINGEWVLFIGAGDILHANNVLETVAKYLVKDGVGRNLVYGQTELVTEKTHKRIRLTGERWTEIKGTWGTLRPALPPHPSSFIHASVFLGNKYKFPLKYKIAGDSHLLLHLIKDKEPLFIPVVVDIMPSGGMSSSAKNQLNVIKEMKMLNKDYNIKIPLTVRLKGIFKLYVYSLLGVLFNIDNVMLYLKKFKK